ncbi:MAG TPA: hypothetical protein VD926_04145 [Acidimicrobiales bacterium]|nr:hypothetical protein [Acidimicrobiales bacterium]
MDDLETVTVGDVDDLNRAALDRSAALARVAGTALVVVGVVGVVAWGWLTVRQQQEASPFAMGFVETSDVSVVDRVTLAAGSYTVLLFSGLALVLGLLARVAADVGQMRAGGSVTGLRAGDTLPYRELDLDEA